MPNPRHAILVLGQTGSGKSSFVETVTDLPVVVGHDITSATMECRSWPWKSYTGEIVDLIDTPGFDDTARPQDEVLKEITRCIQHEAHHIAGVIFLHPIQERRLTGTQRLNLDLLKAICGEHFYSHTYIVSTMWNTLRSKQTTQEAIRRGTALREGTDPVVWKEMLDRGSTYDRFLGTYDSSAKIIDSLLTKHKAPPLQIAIEIKHHTLEDTTAGYVIYAEVRRREEKLRREKEEEEEEARELQETSDAMMREVYPQEFGDIENSTGANKQRTHVRNGHGHIYRDQMERSRVPISDSDSLNSGGGALVSVRKVKRFFR